VLLGPALAVFFTVPYRKEPRMFLPAPIYASINVFLGKVFGGDAPTQTLEFHQVAARAIALYLIGVFLVRFGKSRMLSRTTTLDVLIGFILGSLLSRGVTGHASMSGTIMAAFAIVAAHYVLTWATYHWHWLGNFVKGRSRLIVKDGQMLEDEMKKSHISEHDLMATMRLGGLDDLGQVREAHKERNGEISLIKRDTAPHVIEVEVKQGVQTVRIVLN
jgi:uncharacterized membrane protein YcaP (DUF421 family)